MSQKCSKSQFAVCVIDCKGEIVKEQKKTTLKLHILYLWNLPRPRMNTANSKNTL